MSGEAEAHSLDCKQVNLDLIRKKEMEIKKIDYDFTVCKVKDYMLVNMDDEYCFIGKTDEEKSLVCRTENVPDNVIEQENGWKAFRIQGILDFSLIGVLSKIAALLAKNNIGIFVVSTYNTDYVFVKEEKIFEALQLLADAGYRIV